jgi:RNA polymerase subunit RPABC4/transcription elongation factor Spt4
MRLCTNCHQITVGKPLFCNKCGSSYNLKLCSRLHVNPRAAKICSQCGSKDLSTPQPKVSLLFRPFVFLFGLGPGFLFLGGSWDLSRFLHPQALYRPKRSFAAHVHGFSTRSSFTRLDDAAQGTARIVRWRWKTDFQKEAQRRITQALKKEERCFVKANAEPDWVGSRISGMFGNSHGHWSI